MRRSVLAWKSCSFARLQTRLRLPAALDLGGVPWRAVKPRWQMTAPVPYRVLACATALAEARALAAARA